MPRKSVGGATSSTSTPNTPVSKPRKFNGIAAAAAGSPSVDPETTASATNPLSIPASSKLVLKQQEVALKGIESYELPRGPLIKCAKSSLPDNVQLRKDVQSALVRSASVFISYLTATAHDSVKKKKGKIITAQHVVDAMREIDVVDDEAMRELKDQLRAWRAALERKKERSKEGKLAGEAEAVEGNEADVSRVDGELDEDAEEVEDEEESMMRDEVDDGDASLLKRSLNGQVAGQDEDEDEDDEGADQLMDED